jgi:hypothetical protein
MLFLVYVSAVVLCIAYLIRHMLGAQAICEREYDSCEFVCLCTRVTLTYTALERVRMKSPPKSS